jgi:preprotein translocase subunit SecG
MSEFWKILLMIALAVVAIFMILLVLIQRGRGGGLVGAFGGMGGQSAFGTKAGDLFTRVTMWTAFFWIVLCAVTVKYLSTTDKKIEGAGGALPAGQSEVQGTGDEPGSDADGGASGGTTGGGTTGGGATGGGAKDDGKPK